jgi:hypothetical protein
MVSTFGAEFQHQISVSSMGTKALCQIFFNDSSVHLQVLKVWKNPCKLGSIWTIVEKLPETCREVNMQASKICHLRINSTRFGLHCFWDRSLKCIDTILQGKLLQYSHYFNLPIHDELLVVLCLCNGRGIDMSHSWIGWCRWEISVFHCTHFCSVWFFFQTWKSNNL